jgi:hypothetical protein
MAFIILEAPSGVEPLITGLQAVPLSLGTAPYPHHKRRGIVDALGIPLVSQVALLIRHAQSV